MQNQAPLLHPTLPNVEGKIIETEGGRAAVLWTRTDIIATPIIQHHPVADIEPEVTGYQEKKAQREEADRQAKIAIQESERAEQSQREPEARPRRSKP